MSLARQWQEIQAGLPEGWSDARLSLRVGDEHAAERASTLLAPLQPSRSGRELRFYVARRSGGAAPSALERALARLDEGRIGGELELLATGAATIAAPATPRRTLVEEWDEAVGRLPEDWSDLYAELELTSSDHLDPAALALAPVNPSRFGGTPGFRFRCARRFGYGASPPMVRRCLARLEERGIPGEVRILRVLSDTKPVATQGPVWYVGGKVV
ncbi:MAG TPA: hypothetical protein VFB35_08595 [Gaiellaceae bacterium]|nr:hypothetical protein [Gaiellaceae bacterium]